MSVPHSDNPDCVYGVHAVRLALARASGEAQLFVQKGTAGERTALRELRAEAARLGLTVSVAGKAELTRLAGVPGHQGVVLHRPVQQAAPDLDTLLQTLPGSALWLLLDSVQDPRNLGACLRTAAAVGVGAVIVPSRRSAPLSGVARKAASGGAEQVPVVRVTNLASAMQRLQQEDFWLIGLDGAADRDLYDPDLSMTGRIGIVAGAEGTGLRHRTRESCDFVVRIPMAPGGVPSLNVSVAVGIALFEVRRRARL